MSEFTGFPFSNNASSSTPSFVSGSSSTPSFGSFGPSFSMPNFGSSSSSSPFVSSSATPSFGSSSPSSFSSSSFSSSAPNPNNDEEIIKKIIEAIELLEKKSENGVFPQKKLQEIKQEVENKYPNIFSTQNYTQKNQELYGNHLLAQQQQMMNQIQKMEKQRKNQQELYVNHFLAQQQQMNQYIQSQMNSQIQRMEQQMKIFGQTAPGFSPNYYGVNYPNYNSNYGINYPNYHSNYVDEVSNLVGNYSGLGSDGSSALSFLGSLIGGGLGL